MMDRASFIGLFLGLLALVGGNLLEGGKIGSILQPTAALIVFGGTLGATLLSFPFRDIQKAVLSLRYVFFDKRTDNEAEALIRTVLRYSQTARRNGFIALEPEIQRLENAFLRRALTLSVDGMLPKMLIETMQQENATFEEEQRRVAKVFDTAGGFAPTIGIIGAVLGLIHVMENLSDPAKLGAGIAVAFVATIYGVGTANLILLPIARKLMNRLHRELAFREMALEGVVGLQAGFNPHYLEAKLRAFIETSDDADNG
jgi:chemotaxis protein MotA